MSWADPEGGGGQGVRTPPPPPPPLKNHKNIGLLSKTGRGPLKITKLQCWAIIGLPAKRHLNGVLLAGR